MNIIMTILKIILIIAVPMAVYLAIQVAAESSCINAKLRAPYIKFSKFKEFYTKVPNYCSLDIDEVFIRDIGFRFRGLDLLRYRQFYKKIVISEKKRKGKELLEQLELMLKDD